MQLHRRTLGKLLAGLPFLSWIDPIRAIEQNDRVVHYRANHDGRSLFVLLRDHIRNGIRYDDLIRVLGQFQIIRPAESENMEDQRATPNYQLKDLEHGSFIIEYPLSYACLWLKIKDGVLVEHDPSNYEIYPDHLYLEDGELKPVGKPPDAKEEQSSPC